MELSQITLSQMARGNQFIFDLDEHDKAILRAEHRRHLAHALLFSALAAMKDLTTATEQLLGKLSKLGVLTPAAK